ncbi:MAG: prenyltransferase/squalene oxidase repeat-containing protein [Planctomycetota bacterium]|nr:prenyltransferase/squalene oxidase repeat-containing protein [Planctomycetota bacterium]
MSISSSRLPYIFAALIILALFASVDTVAEEADEPHAVYGEKAVQDATDSALAHIASQIGPDGSLSGTYSNSAITALAGMAFLAGGHTPGRGRYGGKVRKLVDKTLESAHGVSGYISGNRGDNMYGHGFATLFLAEVYGMYPEPEVGKALRKAVRLIEVSQGKQGGWRYQPAPSQSDISVTICQAMALRAARNAGVEVDAEVIERARECVLAAANPDGGFRYIVGQRGSSAFPRSAAGVCILYYLGDYDSEYVKKGHEYLDRFLPLSARLGRNHTMYALYYAAQAMYQAGGKTWAKWYPQICEFLMSRQHSDGSLDSSYGSVYATSIAAIIFQIPKRYLPILQR